MAMTGNTPYVAARAKARRQKLADRARLRQLISQSPDQLTVAIGDIGYRSEMDMYAGRLSGGDLVEAALAHNLEHELEAMVNLCSGKIRSIVDLHEPVRIPQRKSCAALSCKQRRYGESDSLNSS